MIGAEVLVKSLEDLGVRRVYGYNGGAICPVHDELGKAGREAIVNCNEQSSAFSAAGHSRSTGEVGVVVVTSGPAITNTLTAVADSYTDSIPLLVIAGQVLEHKIGTDAFQHIDVDGIFRKVSKKVFAVNNGDSKNIESIVKDAYYLAAAGKPGPVVIDYPVDLQNAECPYNALDIQHFSRTYADENHLGERQCNDFFDLFSKAERPLLYIGGGASNASDELRTFNKRHRIPFTHTLMAHGVMDGRDELSLGMLGMFGTPYANTAIQECDFFFAIGVRWDDRVADKVGDFGRHAKIAYIDINPEKVQEIRMDRHPAFSFIGDAKTALTDLLRHDRDGPPIDAWRDYAVGLKRELPLAYRRDGPVQMAGVLETLSGMIDDNTYVTTGVGNHQMLASQYLRMRRPRTFITSGSFGTMGFGLPAAIGVQCAHPSSRVIVIDGDGSLRMNEGELGTIGDLQIPVKILLLNNSGDGMVRNLQDSKYGGRHYATERKPKDFCTIARGNGIADARRVDDRAAVPSALADWLSSSGPSFLEVVCDKDEAVWPVVPANKGYKDMILGPYIRRVV